ncbi:Na+ dependent nucleoside transporter C-terminus-domain-containing protein [Pilobolus umbonatus]|nr:Na+ dependent nucleoside transporter C-terminus-domain-containing protein [Pilobolus umbonatus]
MMHPFHTPLFYFCVMSENSKIQHSTSITEDPSSVISHISSEEECSIHNEKRPSKLTRIYHQNKAWFHVTYFLISTGFFIAACTLQIPHHGFHQEMIVLTVIYICLCAKLGSSYSPIHLSWMHNYIPYEEFYGIPRKWRIMGYAVIVFAIITITAFSLPEHDDSTRIQRLITLAGLIIFIGILYLTSAHRKAVPWYTVLTAILVQFFLGLFVFRTQVGHDLFQWMAGVAQGYLSKSYYGVQLLFGDDIANSHMFAVSLFPTLIFFAATVQILYYYHILQAIMKKVGTLFMTVLHVSGAESVVAVASPFLGQCENAMLIKPFLPYLTMAELHQIMCSGFATIAGSVLYTYIALGISGQALLTSCIMSIPSSLAVSKLRMPEVEVPLTAKEVKIPPAPNPPVNALQAASEGASIGVHVALLVGANIICLLGLLYAVNSLLTWIGNFLNIQNLTLQFITGYLFVPVSNKKHNIPIKIHLIYAKQIAWLIGVSSKDLVIVGQLLATKLWANEFVAYQLLASQYKSVITNRSYIVTTYALCGFANLASIGMQVGVLSTLAPTRSDDIAKLVVSAMLCGAFSTWISASIAGMLI